MRSCERTLIVLFVALVRGHLEHDSALPVRNTESSHERVAQLLWARL